MEELEADKSPLTIWAYNFEKTKKNLYLQTFLQEIGVKLNKNEGFYHIEINNITNKIKNYSSFY